MRVAVVLAVAALLALVVALVGGGTTFAVLVIALASLGILLLARDWRADRIRHRPGAVFREDAAGEPDASTNVEALVAADGLSPDISTHPDGPSSDARAD